MHNKNIINSNNQLLIRIERKAIDDPACLGSFYDRYSDCIFGQSDMNGKGGISQPEDPVRCAIIHGDKVKSENLLQMIDIQDDLRLNILLHLVPRTRLAAIINHSHPVNEHTRFIQYAYENRTEQLPDDVAEVQKLIGSSSPKATATHIITSVTYGIDAVVVLQLLPHAPIKEIDDALGRVRDILNGNPDRLSITSLDENLFRQNCDILVYSNISYLNVMTSLRNICQFINDRDENYKLFRPLTYTLTPIQLFYPQLTGSDSPFIQLKSTYNDKLEQHLLYYMNTLKSLKYSLDYKVTQLLCGHLEERLVELRRQWVHLKNMQENDIKRLQDLVSKIRHGRHPISEIDEALNDKEQTTFNDNINRIKRDLNDLEEKGQLITDLKQGQFQYRNVVECGIDRRDNETTMECKLISNEQYDRVLCSNDTLNKNNSKQFRKLRDELIEKHKKHSAMHLAYADFSYCSYELTEIVILRSSKHKEEENKLKQEEGSSSTEIPVTSSNREMINILLLGETGVGKSTFINALSNYLTFDTLEQAEKRLPVILIPVSFLITVGDNFDEHIVKFGDVDSTKNENFDHPGESVTQRCKSYVFSLNHMDENKLCIIDTPGFGDTRGVDQDDSNMQHIIEYVRNLSHLNAICFLLKPNESRLNIFFRSCLTQLFSFLGQKIDENIIFCFTNSRSTFYTPGNTAPLVKEKLSSFPGNNISFKNDNVFCFDNESFRYLIALQNTIRFSDVEKPEYEKSWSISVVQSNRLIDYISTKLTSYHIEDKLHTIKHAQLEILRIIRPMLEALRNLLRNLLIHTMSSSNKSIELHPKPIPRSASICTLCPPYPLQVGTFLVSHNIPHEIGNNCNSCQCSVDQHYAIDYVLEYEFLDKPSKYDNNRMTNLRRQLCHACVDFAYFLTNIAGSSRSDPFFTGLVQMIKEEKYLSDNQKPNDLNLQLFNDLRTLQNEYDAQMSSVVHSQKQKELSDIYKLISTIRECPMVCEQMAAVKERQMMMMKQCEYEIPANRKNTFGEMTTTL